MSRASFVTVMVLAFAASLVFRLASLEARPMHHDEANQAVKFGALLETGEYRYDPYDHHGPTLYYLTLPFAWMRGQATLASLDEFTLRAVPVAFGVGLILLLPLLADGLGRPAVAASALLVALSPAMTFFSRVYIQESVFAFFVLGFVIALGRYVTRGDAGSAVATGACAGLAFATKETSVIVLPAALAACVLAATTTERERVRATHVVAGVVTAVAVAGVFFSSFLSDPAGAVESIRALTTYVGRGVDPASHAQPWYYYLRIVSYSASGGLVWTEGLIVGLAVVGTVDAFAGSGQALAARRFWRRYVCLYALVAAIIFSAIPYKTPWNLLPFHVGVIVLAGSGFAALAGMTSSRVARALLVAAFIAGSWHLGVQNWRACVRYPTAPRNPYVYAQTVPDFLGLVSRIRDLAAVHAAHAGMLVQVIADPSEQWPLPWYLRAMPRVGYWQRAADAHPIDAPVVVASQAHVDAIDAVLGDRYVSEFYGLRPDVLLTLYVERGLWEQYLRRGETPKPTEP